MGSKKRVQVSVAKTDLQNIARQMEMFKVEHDRYPEREVGPVHIELAEILKRIGIYEHTR